MTTHPTIAALKAALESERLETSKKYGLDKFPVQNIQTTKDFTQDINFARRMTYSGAYKSGHEAATERLMTIVQKAVEVIQEAAYYCQDQIARTNKAIETDCPQCDYQCEGCIHSIDDTEKLKRIAKEFLTTLADAGEIKKEKP